MREQHTLTDPAGYGITYADNGETFDLTRYADQEHVGNYPTREAAIEAAEADRA